LIVIWRAMTPRNAPALPAACARSARRITFTVVRQSQERSNPNACHPASRLSNQANQSLTLHLVGRLSNRGHNSASSSSIVRKPLLLQRYQLNIKSLLCVIVGCEAEFLVGRQGISFSLAGVGAMGTGDPATSGWVVRIYASFTHLSNGKIPGISLGEVVIWVAECRVGSSLLTHLSFCKIALNSG
jgi:hypothetical protein